MTGLVFLAVIAGSYVWLRAYWEGAGPWAAVALLVAGVELGLLYRHLPLNHRPGETAVLPTFGPGNGLSLARGLLLALLSGFLAAPRPEGWLAWLPVLFYTAADIFDFLDGLAARLANHSTRLGEKLDLEYDSYGVGLIVILAIHFGQIGWWYLILALARYLFVLGTWWRQRRGRPVYDLPPSDYRRLIAGYNMGFLSVILWPILTPEVATVGALVFLTPTLLLFGRDWLIVSGRLDPSGERYRAWLAGVTGFVSDWLPVALRLAIAVTMISSGVIAFDPAGNPAWKKLFSAWGWTEPWVSQAAVALAWLALVVLLAVIAGLWARWLALVAILPTAVNLVAVGVSRAEADSILLVVAVCYIALLNSGRFSLRRRGDEYVLKPIGG